MKKPAPLTDEVKIITLVCFLLENVGDLTEEQLYETATFEDAVSQFALSDALTTVEKKELVIKTDVYKITEKGRAWLSEFHTCLTWTLKKTMLREGEKTARFGRLKKALKWDIKKEKEKYAFRVSFINEMDGSVIMEVKIFAKTKESAEEIREKFLKNPAKIIKNIVDNFI